MIRLDSTTRSLIAYLDFNVTSVQANIIVNYSDNNGTTYVGGTQTSQSNNTSNVTICNAPASSTVRDVDNIAIYNNDIVPLNINVCFKDNSTIYQFVDVTLNPDDTLTYTHSNGWRTTDVNGNIKNTMVTPSILPSTTTAVTQATGDTSTLIATDAFVHNVLNAYTAASQNILQTTQNLGTSVTNGSFNITGTAFSPPGGGVLVSMAYQPVNGGGTQMYDDIEFDHIVATGVIINSTTIQVNWNASTPVSGSYVFNYII